MKKTIVFIAGVALLVSLLGACAPKPTPTPLPPPPTAVPTVQPPTAVPPTATPKPPVKILFWHSSPGWMGDVLKANCDKFNAENPDIIVEPVYQGNFDEFFTKIKSAIQVGEVPDVVAAFPNMVIEFARAGALVPLDSYINDPQIGLSKEDLADFFPGALEGGRYPEFNNQTLSIDSSGACEVMYYNIDMLKAAGFDKPPATWDEFEQVCKAVTKGDVKGYSFTYEPSGFVAQVYSRGGKMIDEQGKPVFNDTIGVETLSFVKKLVDEGVAYFAEGPYADELEFAAGRCALTTGTSTGIYWYGKAMEDAGTKFNWSVTVIPQKPGNKKTNLFSGGWVIFKTNPERQAAAWRFIRWNLGAEQTAESCIANGYMPMRKSAAQYMADYFSKNPANKAAFEEAMPYAETEPAVAGWQEVRDLLRKALERAISGASTPKEALDLAAAEAAKVLSK